MGWRILAIPRAPLLRFRWLRLRALAAPPLECPASVRGLTFGAMPAALRRAEPGSLDDSDASGEEFAACGLAIAAEEDGSTEASFGSAGGRHDGASTASPCGGPGRGHRWGSLSPGGSLGPPQCPR